MKKSSPHYIEKADPYLRDGYECTVREISEEFGISPAGASDLLKKAYRKFRREMIKRMIEKEDLL